MNMPHQTEKLHCGSSDEERDFSLCPAFLLESGHCSFLSYDKWGWGANEKLQCCCAENEQCQCCGGELIQRLGTLLLNTFFFMQKPGGQKHMCAVFVLWSAPVDFLGRGKGIQTGPNRYFRALLLGNNGTWSSHRRVCLNGTANSLQWGECSYSLLYLGSYKKAHKDFCSPWLAM